MAVNPPPAVVPNTVPDPVRKWTAVAAFGAGLALEVLGALVAAFHLGDPQPLLVGGGGMVALGAGIIWDRQVPAA